MSLKSVQQTVQQNFPQNKNQFYSSSIGEKGFNLGKYFYYVVYIICYSFLKFEVFLPVFFYLISNKFYHPFYHPFSTHISILKIQGLGGRIRNILTNMSTNKQT